MPIYEYICPGCGHPFEKRVGFSQSDDPQTCPECGNKHARRQISLVGGFTSGGQAGSRVTPPPACGPVG
jgi:putative FmdB family regulatory protein